MLCSYIRVSSDRQSYARQQEILSKYKIDREFYEKASAKNLDRPELKKLIDFCREGDEIIITDFSRISRNVDDLEKLIGIFNSKGVKLISVRENFDTSTSIGRLLLRFISDINTT